jgi:hypothetical protein
MKVQSLLAMLKKQEANSNGTRKNSNEANSKNGAPRNSNKANSKNGAPNQTKRKANSTNGVCKKSKHKASTFKKMPRYFIRAMRFEGFDF